MLNLLPIEEKKAVRKEYRFRLWSAIFTLSLFTLISAIFLFLPSLAKINFDIEQTKNDLEIFSKKPAVSDYQHFSAIIKGTKMEIENLNKEIAAHSNIADEIKKALKSKPSGINVEYINWLNDNDNGNKLVLGGEAANRSILSRYYDILNSDNSFTTVTLPISDLAKSEGSQFSITINFKKGDQ